MPGYARDTACDIPLCLAVFSNVTSEDLICAQKYSRTDAKWATNTVVWIGANCENYLSAAVFSLSSVELADKMRFWEWNIPASLKGQGHLSHKDKFLLV
jgi:hypothetical protein